MTITEASQHANYVRHLLRHGQWETARMAERECYLKFVQAVAAGQVDETAKVAQELLKGLDVQGCCG